MRGLLLILVRGYQYLISPMLGPNCRFHPSCSEYAVQALEKHGAGCGSVLALKRLCRCHPLNPGGYDPGP